LTYHWPTRRLLLFKLGPFIPTGFFYGPRPGIPPPAGAGPGPVLTFRSRTSVCETWFTTPVLGRPLSFFVCVLFFFFSRFFAARVFLWTRAPKLLEPPSCPPHQDYVSTGTHFSSRGVLTSPRFFWFSFFVFSLLAFSFCAWPFFHGGFRAPLPTPPPVSCLAPWSASLGFSFLSSSMGYPTLNRASPVLLTPFRVSAF